MSAFSDKIEAKYPGGQWRTVRGHKVYFHDGKAVPESLPADWGGKSTAEKPPSAKKPSTAKGKEPVATSLLGLLDSHKRRGRVAAKPSAKKPSTVASKYGVGESVLYQFPSGEWGPAVVKRVTKNHEAVLGGFRGASKVRVTIPLDSPLLKPVADAAKSSPNTKKLVEAQADRDRAVRDHAAAVAKAKAAEKPQQNGVYQDPDTTGVAPPKGFKSWKAWLAWANAEGAKQQAELQQLVKKNPAMADKLGLMFGDKYERQEIRARHAAKRGSGLSAAEEAAIDAQAKRQVDAAIRAHEQATKHLPKRTEAEKQAIMAEARVGRRFEGAPWKAGAETRKYEITHIVAGDKYNNGYVKYRDLADGVQTIAYGLAEPHIFGRWLNDEESKPSDDEATTTRFGRHELQRLHDERNGEGLDIFKPFGPHNRHISDLKAKPNPIDSKAAPLAMHNAADLNAELRRYADKHGADSAEMPGIAAALMLRYKQDVGADLGYVDFPIKPLKGQLLKKSQRLLHVILVKEVRS